MSSDLKLYNTYSGKTEKFEALNPPYVGMYLCGPTVYGYPHLGHSRGPVLMDILFRYLSHLGYKIRYVRNITDVGHLLGDSDEGDDKINKRARLEQIEPMEVVQKYTLAYHKAINQLNVWPPSIEPSASGHIQEQVDMIAEIIRNGYGYEVNGSVYFDVMKYAGEHDYGKLSGRKTEDLIAGAGELRRTLEGQEEKRNPHDFALWKKAGEEHLMQWKSPWGMGFPGWHIECSAMSAKYLGKTFDIHAGGIDLLFPHHESEIAQSTACNLRGPAKYWIHNNMITINGQKMAKSLDNGILLEELYSGEHHLLDKGYGPMVLRFFLLQAHYRSTVDFSNEALFAAEKGYHRLSDAINALRTLKSGDKSDMDVAQWKAKFYEVMNEDLNTPQAIALLFEAVKWINEIKNGTKQISDPDKKLLEESFSLFFCDILGFVLPGKEQKNQYFEDMMRLLLDIRQEAKAKRDFTTSDKIRDELKNMGIEIMDGKEGSSYKTV